MNPVIRGKKKKLKEELVHMYNTGMGGVDLADAYLHSSVLFPHKRSKWTRCLYFTLLGFMVSNSYIFWKTLKGENYVKKNCKRSYMEALIQQWTHKTLVEKKFGFSASKKSTLACSCKLYLPKTSQVCLL